MDQNKKSILKRLVVLLLFTSILYSCEKEESEIDRVVLPSNLIVELTIDPNVEGLVHVSASAEKVNFYSFIFNDNGKTSSERNNEGKQSYQYNQSGSYDIIVRAHTSTADYIEVKKAVSISIGTPGFGGGYPTTGYTTPLSYPNYKLVWNDEFNGSSLVSTNWNYEIGTGNGGWGNNELQYYLQSNAEVKDGYLTIEAKKQFFNGSNFTSSRITTQNKQSFKYGRIDIRAALPFGQGLWPALWMLGENISTVGWPKCGEIDIMELVGGNIAAGSGDNKVHGTCHWFNESNNVKADFSGQNSLPTKTFADEFHVFSIVWDSQRIDWYRDDIKYHSIDITPSSLSEFHQKHFFIFNVAVGGNWPGSPNNTTIFPQFMFVDYIRVFQ